jgi:archaellum component FlaG (FlaF/FlaG flagellin family)
MFMNILFKRNAKKVPALSIGLLGSAALLVAGLVVVVLRDSSHLLAEGIKEKAAAITSTTGQTEVKPPIDLSVPEYTKTATFALG